MLANPALTTLITEAIGDKWVSDLTRLRDLEKFAGDAAFVEKWRNVKLDNKRALAMSAWEKNQLQFDPASMFDVQVKRIHEYKRQHLNVLHAITLYRRLKLDAKRDESPRTIIFGGKAAPGYLTAKLIIKLIHSVGEVINNDRDMRDRLRIVFLPDLNVKNAQRIYPAADLSEQISTAGKEASGTGNMKFALNGALTIGTLDGANIEIREEVGEDNFFLFGLTAEEVLRMQTEGYRPRDIYEHNDELREAIELLRSGFFSRGDRTLFEGLVNGLLEHDGFMLLADFASYVDCQSRVSAAFADTKQWTRMSILNTARMGKFSSDRAIREYCEDIWKIKPVRVAMNGAHRK
jgi:starch phosphorylase